MRLSKIVQKAAQELRRAQIPVYAAAAAFFLVLSFLPLTTLLLAVLQYTVFSPDDVLALLSRIAPDEVLPLFESFLLRSYQTSGAAVISVSAIAAAWSASKGIYGMTRGLKKNPKAAWPLRLVTLHLFSFGLLIFSGRLFG